MRKEITKDIEQILADNFYKTNFCIPDLVLYVLGVRRKTIRQIKKCLKEQGLNPDIKLRGIK